jgi:erythromycin esterase
VSNLHWVWETEEIVALVEWMRAWNAESAHANKVHMIGIDMQESGGAYAGVAAFLERVAPERAADWLAPISVMGRGLGRQAVEDLTPAEQTGLIGALELLALRFDQNSTAFAGATSPVDFASARQMVVVMQQAATEAATGPPGAAGQAVRNRAMVDNIAWIREQNPSVRMAVWAHNLHLRSDAAAPGAVRECGDYLRERYERDYVSFGQLFGHGAYAALDVNHGYNLEEIVLAPAPDYYASAAFTGAGVARGVLDLRALPADGPVAAWFRAPHLVRESGYTFRSEAALTHSFVLPDRYDVIVYLESVGRSQATPLSRSRFP